MTHSAWLPDWHASAHAVTEEDTDTPVSVHVVGRYASHCTSAAYSRYAYRATSTHATNVTQEPGEMAIV